MFHSLCLITNSQEDRENFVNKVLTAEKIQPVDLIRIEADSTGIAEVRRLKAFLALKPFASPFKLALLDGDSLSMEAQQALLKTLEEPPDQSLVIIYTANQARLLPTIISRCQTVDIKLQNEAINNEDWETEREYWHQVVLASPGKRLETTSLLTKNDRQKLAAWMTIQINYFRQALLNLYHAPQPANQGMTAAETIKIIRLLLQAQADLSQNISLKSAVDRLFLNLPKIATKTHAA